MAITLVNVGIALDDIEAAAAFFTDLGLGWHRISRRAEHA